MSKAAAQLTTKQQSILRLISADLFPFMPYKFGFRAKYCRWRRLPMVDDETLFAVHADIRIYGETRIYSIMRSILKI